jgi:tetratricopeptide (TPR) repeat protein
VEQDEFQQNWKRVDYYETVGLYEKAASLAAEMVAARPENINARLLLISALYHKGSEKEALRVTHDLLALDAEYATGWHWVAILTPKPREKRAAIERAITLQPDTASFYAAKAWVLMQQMGMQPWIPWSEVEKSARRALEIDPENREAHLHLSSALTWSQRDAARHHCEIVLSLHPEDADALRQLSYIESLDNKHGKSYTAVSQSLQLDPHDKWAQYQLRIETIKAKQEARRLRRYRYMAVIYRKIFGRWPAILIIPFFLAAFTALLAGVFIFMGQFSTGFSGGRNWQILDGVAFMLAMACLLSLEYALIPLLKFIPDKWLSPQLKQYGKRSG